MKGGRDSGSVRDVTRSGRDGVSSRCCTARAGLFCVFESVFYVSPRVLHSERFNV